MLLNDLYQEIIMDHYRNPRNTASLDTVADEFVHANPTCGDSIKVEVDIEDQRIILMLYDHKGCAISTASASILSELVRGRTITEARKLVEKFLAVMRGEKSAAELDDWGGAACLKGIINFPVRVKCATLAWHALLSRLDRI